MGCLHTNRECISGRPVGYYQLSYNKNSSGDEIANVNFLRRHRTCRGQRLRRPNGWMDQDATWYGGGPRPRPHYARWGPSSSSSKKGEHSPELSVHVCCGQTAGWIKMPFGMEVQRRLRPRPHCVRWGRRSLKKGAELPVCGPCSL